MVSSKMMYRVVVALLITGQLAQASAPAIRLLWSGSKSTHCQQLVEAFLRELRSMASDRSIQLEAFANGGANGGSEQNLEIRCPGQPGSETLEIVDGKETLTLHYLAKASGFDSMDWLPFQERYLRPDAGSQPAQDISLAPTEKAPDPLPAASPLATQKMISETGSNPSIFKRWWFWALVGGASAGIAAFALTRGGNSSSSLNVEIH